MTITAIILAGGVGKRMGADCPKQFLTIHGKPIIAHTLDNFQNNKNVDSIIVVCLDTWFDHLKKIISKYNLTKVKDIVSGGDTSHDSTRNGIFALRDKLGDGDYVIIHDAARPILPQRAINEMIAMAKEKGNASLAIPCYETVIYTEDKKSGDKELHRDNIMRIQTPQTYHYPEILSLYELAEKENKHDFIYADLVYIYYGKRIYFSKGFTNNIKITKQEDLILCESLMKFSEDQLFTL